MCDPARRKNRAIAAECPDNNLKLFCEIVTNNLNIISYNLRNGHPEAVGRKPIDRDPPFDGEGDSTRKPQPEDRLIGARLRRARGRLSQTKLGQHLGISQQQVVRYESGRSSLKAWMLVRAATFLGVEAHTLLGPDGDLRRGFAEQAADYRAPAGAAAVDGAIRALKSAITEIEAMREPPRPGRRKR